jgi:hypothetical protein
MIPAALFFIAVATNNVYIVAFAALGVPAAYVLVAGTAEFLASYSAKGGEQHPFRIYTNEERTRGWTREIGDIDKVMDLHRSGKTITHIEPTVHFSIANFSSLGLDLALGAIAVDIAWAIDGTVNSTLLFTCLAVQVVIAFGSLFALQINQKARPDQRWLGNWSAVGAIFLGFCAMFLSFVALAPGVVSIF